MHHWTPFLGSQNGFQKRWLEKRELFMHFWYSKTTKIKVYDEQKEPFEKANKTLKKIFCAMCRRKVKSFFRGCILSRIVVCHKRIFQEMVPKESSQVLTALCPYHSGWKLPKNLIFQHFWNKIIIILAQKFNYQKKSEDWKWDIFGWFSHTVYIFFVPFIWLFLFCSRRFNTSCHFLFDLIFCIGGREWKSPADLKQQSKWGFSSQSQSSSRTSVFNCDPELEIRNCINQKIAWLLGYTAGFATSS